MAEIVAITGNIAVANAMRQINPDVCAAYPITPSTEIMQQFASFVSDGKVDTELVTVESEHSAMSACIGASLAGGRVMTATSANGMALMWEMLYIASGSRTPIIMALVNRALSAPLNIHGDHSDAMGARDSGWIQLFSSNAQEAYDNTIQAVRIGEHMDVRLPVMSCMDGFIVSHSIERMEIADDQKVKDFIGDFKPVYSLLDVEHPMTFGPIDLQDYYTEHKRQQFEAMNNAKQVIIDIGKEFGEKFGRYYGLFEPYKLDDADIAIVVMGSAASTTQYVVDIFREKGIKAGTLKLRVFRPFPAEELKEVLSHVKVIGVLDRADSFGGYGGPLFMELRSALYGITNPPVIISRIYGLGGRDTGPNDIEKAFNQLLKIHDTGKIDNLIDYLNVRE